MLINWTSGQSAPQQICGWHRIWMLEDRDLIQRDIDRMEKWVEKNLMEFQERSIQSPAAGMGKSHARAAVWEPIFQSMPFVLPTAREFFHSVCTTWTESNFAEKVLGILMENKSNMSQQRTFASKAANNVLSCISRSEAS